MYMRTGSVVLLLDVVIGLRRRRLVGVQHQLFLVGRLVVDPDAHVAERRDDRLDLFRVHQVVGQVVVDLRIGEEAAVLAQLDQVLQARAARLGVFLGQFGRDQPGVLLALAPRAPLELGFRRRDVGFKELERLLGALDSRLGAGFANEFAGELPLLLFQLARAFARRSLDGRDNLFGDDFFERLPGSFAFFRRRARLGR
jgi:hypothetical protein